jgi:hypothetical protein
MRSRTLHEAWVAALPGAVVRLEGDQSVGEQLAQIEARMDAGLLILVRLRENGEAVDAIHERDRRKPEQHEAR